MCVSDFGFVSIFIGSGVYRETEQEGDGGGGYRKTREEMTGACGLQEITFSILGPYCMCVHALLCLL